MNQPRPFTQLEFADIIEMLQSFFEAQVQNAELIETQNINDEIVSINPEKSVNIFVNGYRFTKDLLLHQQELPNTQNAIYSKDIWGYWAGLDAKFLKRLQSSQAYYADGHCSMSSSNHQTIERFIQSFFTYLRQIENKASFKSIANTLNVKANIEGFAFRYKEGLKAGDSLIKKIKALGVAQKVKLNFIAHSMGYAYALGIIDAVKNENIICLEQLFIIAPENAQAQKINYHLFKKVWQYGSYGINNTPPYILLEIDGLAPQDTVFDEGFNENENYGRIFIPKNFSPQGFIESHLIKNYTWIFDDIKKNERGYIY